MKTHYIFLFTFTVFAFSVFAGSIQNSGEYQFNQLKQDIVRLKNEQKIMKDSIVFIQIQAKLANETYTTAKEFINIKESAINWFFIFLTFFISLLGLTGVWSIKNYINKKFEKLLSDKEKDLIAVVKKHSKEQLLLEKTRILIINHEDTTLDFKFNMILKRFNNTPLVQSTVDFKNIVERTLSGFDVIILDNFDNNKKPLIWDFNKTENSDLYENLIRIAKITGNNNSVFLYFGDDNKDGKFSLDPELKEVNHLINFANKPATLFANLIDLLDFRRLFSSN